MQKIYNYIIGFLINLLNDIFLFRYLLTISFKRFRIHFTTLFIVYFKFLKNKSFYKKQIIDFKSLKENKKTDKLFIFGSGASIKEIDDEAWKKINAYDSLGFNGTFRLEKVDFNYHILRAGNESPNIDGNFLNDEITYAKYIMTIINKNIYLKKTIFLFSRGISQHFPNLLLGYKFWNKNNLIYRYNTNKFDKYPKGNISRGLIHRIGTLMDAITFGYHMGYKEIILVGIDLYNNEYFWTEKNKTTRYDRALGVEVDSNNDFDGVNVNDPHNTVNNGIINSVDEWGIYFKKKNIKLSIYNPKSLLNKVLPIFKF